ncbi:MAG TPA: SDR family NAD(P)-dependent oxidoreductase [Polyangiaceae bacterium]|nr:SDR family NAD(P)-dependent oxidoreductase [Polyangiaceae bacterium]
MNLQGKKAIVIGASTGVGRAVTESLLSQGARVTAVARAAEGLRALQSELGSPIDVRQADAAEPSTAQRLLAELQPDYVVLSAGVRPQMGAIDELSWETFSEAWTSDTKAAFHLVQAALRLPLRPGSVVAVVSSGAAINGSYLSGGYAGAKRMQWLLAGYAQKIADERKLGIRFLAVVPKQLIEGTVIATVASERYARALSISPAAYMKRFEVPLHCDQVAAGIVTGLRGELAPHLTAIGVTGTGIEPLA